MIITQIRSKDGTGTLSYLISDKENKLASVIDPNIEDIKTIKALAEENGVKITIIFDTHTHADHISGADELKKLYSAEIYMHEKTKYKMKVLENAARFGIEDILKVNAAIKIDHYINEGDIISSGSIKIKVLHTPGHTDNHIALLVEDNLFTGDLLLIGQAGRSDLPGGNPEDQYYSLFNKIITLPEETKIYPGHDYENNEFSNLKYELKNNPFLQKRTKEEYLEFVKDFFPPFAEASGEGRKMTLQCGVQRVAQISDEGFKSITVNDLVNLMNSKKDFFLLDVREPHELLKGAVPGVINIPVDELPDRLIELPDKLKKIICICARGNRSYEASDYLAKQGYKNVMNLKGGTFEWLNSGYEIVK